MATTEPVRLELRGILLAVVQVHDPEERLRRLAVVGEGVDDLEARIRRLKRSAILELRRDGWHWHRIGAVLGVSAQRAEQLSKVDPTKEKFPCPKTPATLTSS